MADREKIVRYGKKALVILLRIIGCFLLIGIIGTAADFLYRVQITFHGAASFVGAPNVIYTGDLWEYIYTNPVAMMRYHFLKFLLISAGVCTASAIAVWIIRKGKLFASVGRFDKFLIAALFFSVITCVCCGGMASQTNVIEAKQYHMVKACKTLADYEKLLGRPLWEGIVREKDREWLSGFGNFEKSGFVPGRKLMIFGMERPYVYILLWMEDDKIVQRNGCYRDVLLRRKGGSAIPL